MMSRVTKEATPPWRWALYGLSIGWRYLNINTKVRRATGSHQIYTAKWPSTSEISNTEGQTDTQRLVPSLLNCKPWLVARLRFSVRIPKGLSPSIIPSPYSTCQSSKQGQVIAQLYGHRLLYLFSIATSVSFVPSATLVDKTQLPKGN